MVHDFPVFEIKSINQNVNSPTAVTLTEAFFPAPTLLIGTQVYVPSDITVTLKIPKLLVIMSLLLKYKWNSASGLASAWHVNLRGLLRSSVVLLRAEMSFASPGASKKKGNQIMKLTKVIVNCFCRCQLLECCIFPKRTREYLFLLLLLRILNPKKRQWKDKQMIAVVLDCFYIALQCYWEMW